MNLLKHLQRATVTDPVFCHLLDVAIVERKIEDDGH